jgi:hypothetical protein
MPSQFCRSASHKETPKYLHIVIGIVIATALISGLQCFLNGAMLISLVIFNLLFLLLTFPLSGPLWCKIVWLMLGNGVGILWGLISLSFTSVLEPCTYGILDFFLSHVIDFLWIVPIWSLALSSLGFTKHRKKSAEDQ